MGAIVIKSKVKAVKADALKAQDAFVQCSLLSFDMLSYSYRIEYSVLLERIDEEDNPIIEKQVLKVSSGKFSSQEIQMLFDVTGKDIAQGENFDAEMRDIITTALIYNIVNDGYFALTAQDWEIII